jgi:hypothetical protein
VAESDDDALTGAAKKVPASLTFPLAADRLALNYTGPAVPAKSKVAVRAFWGKEQKPLDLDLILVVGENSEVISV